MSAYDTLVNIADTNLILVDDFRYCLVGADKKPYTVKGDMARPNAKEDFVTIEEIASAENLEKYAGVGISIQASGVCAIDVDHCFKTPFDFKSGDERALYVYSHFKDLAYIEFSFSGTGMRVLFFQDNIENYSDSYYIKNSITEIEYYQPGNSARYVTVTGRAICNNQITKGNDFKDVIIDFLNKYMARAKQVKREPKTIVEVQDLDKALKRVNGHLFRDVNFQNLWYDREEWAYAKNYPGIGESEHDAALLTYIYNNFSHNKEMVKAIFEESPYFKSKDAKHRAKWYRANCDYFERVFGSIEGK